jgi:CheY-like chemotaxis protein
MDGKKILIIDDVFQIRYSVTQFLTGHGFFVFSAENGRKGLEYFEKIRPDLIILDHNLRDMNSIEFLEDLRKYENNLKDVVRINNTPVIVISGYLKDEMINPLMEKLGILAFMRKPLLLVDLLSNIELAFGGNQVFNISTTQEIAICDTEIRTAKYLQGYLTTLNYNVNIGTSFLDLKSLIMEHKPDFVICDCFVETPGIGQFDIIGFCRQYNKNSKIILTTFENSCKLENTFKYLGFEGIITKPIDLDLLKNHLEKSKIAAVATH